MTWSVVVDTPEIVPLSAYIPGVLTPHRQDEWSTHLWICIQYILRLLPCIHKSVVVLTLHGQDEWIIHLWICIQYMLDLRHCQTRSKSVFTVLRCFVAQFGDFFAE